MFMYSELKQVALRRKLVRAYVHEHFDREEFTHLSKSFKQKVKEVIKETRFPLLFELIKWLLIDMYRAYRDKKNGIVKPLRIHGIHIIAGKTGGGKTTSATQMAEEYRKKYGDRLYIGTNYYYAGEDFRINDFQDLLVLRDKTCLYIIDESAVEFNSRSYKSFPTQLMNVLTQNRHGNGAMLVFITQDYTMIDAIIRKLAHSVTFCKTRLNGRLTSTKTWDIEDYEHFISIADVGKKMKIRPRAKKMFVQSDFLRSKFDTYQLWDSLKEKDYMTQDEIKAIERDNK